MSADLVALLRSKKKDHLQEQIKEIDKQLDQDLSDIKDALKINFSYTNTWIIAVEMSPAAERNTPKSFPSRGQHITDSIGVYDRYKDSISISCASYFDLGIVPISFTWSMNPHEIGLPHSHFLPLPETIFVRYVEKSTYLKYEQWKAEALDRKSSIRFYQTVANN